VKLIYIVFGIIGPIAVSILQVVNKTTQDVGNVLRWVFYPVPIFSLTFGYISIANREIIRAVQQLKEDPPIWGKDVSGPALAFLCGMLVFYWLMVVCFEMRVFRAICCCGGKNRTVDKATSGSFRGPGKIDEDIVEEENRVHKKDPQQLPVRMTNLRKDYGATKAVKNLSFGLEYGECFALLGVSGAGKTSVFKCMTGEIQPTRGELTICGYDVATQGGWQQARSKIGYCPQFDAIFEGLTVLEHL